LITLITVIHVVVSVILILVILLQAGKEGSGGMGAAFGGSSQTVFGGRGAQTFLGKVTAACAAIFMVTSVTLAVLSGRSGSVVRSDVPARGAPALPGGGPVPPAPAAPPASTPAPAPAPAPAAPPASGK
jgi:preprotein translocase subunit SecG